MKDVDSFRVFFFNGEYKICWVESVIKKKKYLIGKFFKFYYYLNFFGFIIFLWLNDKSKSEMGILFIDVNKEVSKYNN